MFAAPTRAELQVTVLRALRDTNGSVFNPATVNDFIMQAMANLSAYRPNEGREVQPWPLPVDPVPFVGFTSVWKVEVRVLNMAGDYIITTYIPYGDSNSSENRAGWDFYGGTLYIPPFWTRRIDAQTENRNAEVWVWGYADRDLPLADDDVLDLTDATDYLCVIEDCKSQGFDALVHDRSLYQQWIAQTNNTDVSPTQLQGMAGMAVATFEKMRSRNTKMRRVPSGDYLHAH